MKKLLDKLIKPHPLPSADDALTEARVILLGLSECLPSQLGAAHGLAFIHAARKWVAAYVEKP